MIIINIISLILDGILSVLLDNNSLFVSLFSVVSLIVIYPYLSTKKNIFIYGAITGCLYDIVYTQTPFLNTLIFIMISAIIYFWFKFLPINFFNSLFLTFIVIFVFRAFVYFIQVFVGNIKLNFSLFLKSFYSSIISNIIYYAITFFLLKKFDLKDRKRVSYNYKTKK